MKPNLAGMFLNDPFCTWMIIEWSLIKFVFFVMIWNPRWPPPQVIVLTRDHMGKYRNIFFSEAIALIEPKLCINHFKLCVFYVDRNSKMTTTAGHSFYIHVGQAIALIEPKLCINNWKVLSNFVFFMLIGIPRWLPLQDIVFT